MIRDLIPAKARKIVYIVFGFVITAESSLDAINAGLISTRAQGVIIAVAAAAGFTLAAGNTNKEG